MEDVQIHDTGNGRLHEEEGAIHSFFAEGAKHVHLWAITNMFQGGTWIFAAPDPAVVGIVKLFLKHPVYWSTLGPHATSEVLLYSLRAECGVC